MNVLNVGLCSLFNETKVLRRIVDEFRPGPDAEFDVAESWIRHHKLVFRHQKGHQVSRHHHSRLEDVPNVAQLAIAA